MLLVGDVQTLKTVKLIQLMNLIILVTPVSFMKLHISGWSSFNQMLISIK